MQIDVSKVEQKLALLASSEGFEDVEAYVTQQVHAMANEKVPDELLNLTPEQMAESVEMIRDGNAEFAAGGGRDFNEVMQEIADKHGFACCDGTDALEKS